MFRFFFIFIFILFLFSCNVSKSVNGKVKFVETEAFINSYTQVFFYILRKKYK